MDTIISILITLLASVVFAVVATVLGCLLAGLDRKVTARMQGRVGPPLLQPYYDVRKLFSKENTAVKYCYWHVCILGSYLYLHCWWCVFLRKSSALHLYCYARRNAFYHGCIRCTFSLCRSWC